MKEEGALRIAALRFRSTFRSRRGGYLAIILIVGLLGGLSLGALAGARRTQSAFPRFLKASNPSDLSIDEGPYNPGIAKGLRTLPGVTALRTYVAFNVSRLDRRGYPPKQDASNGYSSIEFVGSLNGLYFTQDRIALLEGRMADTSKPDEVMVSEQTANLVHLKVGDPLPVGFYSAEQVNNSNFDPYHARPYRTEHLRIVGIGEFADEVVQDDVDKIPRLLITPALTRQVVACCSSYAWNGIQLKGGRAAVSAIERAYASHIPKGYPVYVRVNSVVEAQGERAVKPESIALGVFGIIIGLAALILGVQAVGRQIALAEDEHTVMRALGASPRLLLAADLIGILGAILVGALGAAVVAVALSPIAPIGVMHRIEVVPGLSFDWTVLLGGIAAFSLVLGVAASVIAFRHAPHRLALRRGTNRLRPSGTMGAVASSGLPPSAVTGIGLALNAGRSRNAVPIRSAIVGTALALITLTSAITFGTSLNNLVNHPSLYGWNWTGGVISNGGYGDVPGKEATRILNADSAVSSWNGIYLGSLQIDGQLVPVAGATKVQARLNPPILSGHPIRSQHEIVLGASTLGDLHKQIGDTVTVTNSNASTRLRIVGTATLPALGVGHGLHMSMGSGAWVSYTLLPKPARNITGDKFPGPNILLIRYRDSVSVQYFSNDMTRIGNLLNSYNPNHVDPAQLPSVTPLSVQRPAEIVNYRAMGAAPVILGAALALGASLALAVALAASVRRRRRELALLKALGFTRGQLRAIVAWQSSVVVVVGTVIGVPLGIAFGRVLWNAFAGELHVIATPTVPAFWILAIALSAVFLANLVAAIPGRSAGRTPAGLVLREE